MALLEKKLFLLNIIYIRNKGYFPLKINLTIDL